MFQPLYTAEEMRATEQGHHVEALMETMKQQGFACSPLQDEGWGLLTLVALPGGGKLGIYEPRHARPPAKPR